MDAATFAQLQKQVLGWNRTNGLNMIDLLEMADPLRQVVNWIVRQDQVTLLQLSKFLQYDLESTQLLVDQMIDHRLLTQLTHNGDVWIRVQLTIRSHKPTTTKSILDDL